MRFWPALGTKSAKSSWRRSVCCEPEQFELRSSALIRLGNQGMRTWYHSADKNHVQHVGELFKQGFPVKTCSEFPTSATIFFWSANIKAVCYSWPCRGHHFRELSSGHSAPHNICSSVKTFGHSPSCSEDTTQHSPDRGSEDVRPQVSQLLGDSSYRGGRKWKEKVCFFYWLKISKSEYSITGVPGAAEVSCWSHREGYKSQRHPNELQCHSGSCARPQREKHQQHMPYPCQRCPNKTSQEIKKPGDALSPTIFNFVFNQKSEKHLFSPEEKDCKSIFSLINLLLDQVFDFLF